MVQTNLYFPCIMKFKGIGYRFMRMYVIEDLILSDAYNFILDQRISCLFQRNRFELAIKGGTLYYGKIT